MQFSVRREAHFETYAQDLSGLAHVPIELALPYKLDEYLQGAAELPGLAAFIHRGASAAPRSTPPRGASPTTVLSHGRARRYGLPSPSARSIVFHPENVRKDERTNLQLLALRNIQQLQRATNVRVAVETFGSRKRVLLPEELGESGLWMVLDTSHVFQERALDLIRRYHAIIAGVHLSEMREDEATGEVRPHMPVEGFGFEVLRLLAGEGLARHGDPGIPSRIP